MAGKLASVAMHLLGTMILARLLTPREMGIFAVSAAAATLLTAFKNLGTSNYLVQCKDVDQFAVGSAFTVTFLMSAFFSISLFLLSHSFAGFFNEPQIEPVVRLMAANLLVTPFHTIGTALLIRAQLFNKLVKIEVLAAAAAITVSTATASMGFGAMALALAMTAHSVLTLILMLNSRPPGLTYRPSIRDLRQVIGFGGWSSGASLLNQLSARSGEFIIGRAIGVTSAAMFDKGAALARLVTEQFLDDVLRVLLPVFAEQRRYNNQVKDRYMSYISILGSILGPLFIFLAFNAYPLIYLLYGDQWLAAVPVASAISIEYMLIGTCLVGEKLLIADGRIRTLFRLKALQIVLRVSALLVFVNYGLVAVAGGLVLAAVFYTIVVHSTIRKILRASWSDVARSLRHPIVASVGAIAAGAATTIVFGYADSRAPFTQILFSSILSLLIWQSLARSFNFSAYRIGMERATAALRGWRKRPRS